MASVKITGIIVAGLVTAVVSFFISLFLLKFFWAWTITDLFPGAVSQGLIAAQIS